MKNSILFICSFFLWGAQAQSFQWAKKVGGANKDNGYAVTTDVAGNIYCVGSFTGTVDFDPGAPVKNLVSVDTLDVYVTKSDPSGNLVWAKSFGSDLRDLGLSIALDMAGNVLVCGVFRNTVDFDPGSGVFPLTSSGSDDAFLAKLDAAGDLVWAQKFGASNPDVAYMVKTDNNGNVYCTGGFQGTVDFDAGPNINSLTSKGSYDIFILKLDSFGKYIWARSVGSTSDDFGYAIQIDGAGNVVTSGYFFTTMDFDPGAGVVNITPYGGIDVFILKLNSAGNFVWVKRVGGGQLDYSYDHYVDATGNIYMTGSFSGTADFDPSGGVLNKSAQGIGMDMYLSKFDSSGNLLWVNTFGGSGVNDKSYCVTVDGLGDIYTAGFFQATCDFDPSIANYTITSKGKEDMFISKYGKDGNFLWAISFGDVEYDDCRSISLTGANLVVTGSFEGTVDADPGAGVNNLTGIGKSDIYFLKLGKGPTTANVSDYAISSITIYPNPGKGIYQIQVPAFLSAADIIVYDKLGEKVHAQKAETGLAMIDIRHLSAGSYFIKMRIDNKSFNEVLIHGN